MDPRIRHFVVRTSPDPSAHVYVPLIPADMLPNWLEVIGAPRSVSQTQAHARGMYSVGESPRERGADGGPSTLQVICSGCLVPGMAPGVEDDEDDNNDDSSEDAHISSSASSPQAAEPGAPVPVGSAPGTATPVGSSSHAAGAESARHASPPSPQEPSDDQQHHDDSRAPATTAQPKQQQPGRPAGMAHRTKNFCRHWCHHGS